MALPLLAAAALGAGLGVGGGWLSDKYLGDDDYSWGEGATDATFGLFGGGIGSLAKNVLGRAAVSGVSRIPLGALARTGRYGPMAWSAGRMAGAGLPAAGALWGGWNAQGGLNGLGTTPDGKPIQGPPAPGMDPFAGLMGGAAAPSENPMLAALKLYRTIPGELRDAPAPPSMTIFDYMADPRNQRLADQTIKAATVPHRHAIKQRKGELREELSTIKDLEREYQRESRNIRTAHSKESKSLAKNLAKSTKSTSQELDESFNKIAASMVGNDAQRAELAASREAAKQRTANSSKDAETFAASMSEGGDESLSQIAEASQLQSQGESRESRIDARKDIGDVRSQMHEIQAQRPTILQSVAQQMVANDLNRYEAALKSLQTKQNMFSTAMQMAPNYMQSQGGGLDAKDLFGMQLDWLKYQQSMSPQFTIQGMMPANHPYVQMGLAEAGSPMELQGYAGG